LIFLGLTSVVSAESTRPNVILIMADDLGYGDVGFNGNDQIITPSIDQLAAEGVVLDRFYTSASICSPSRAAALTGRHHYRTGVLAAHTAGLRIGEVTIAEVLQEHGYATGFFGKWHLGWVRPDATSDRGYYSPPWHHGFDVAFATKSAVPTWDPNLTPFNIFGHKKGDKWHSVSPYLLNGEPVTDNLEGDDSRVIMDRVIPFIRENVQQGEPFAAVVWFHTPHDPVVAGPEYLSMYKSLARKEQRHFYGAITAMDEQIGRLRAELKDLGVEEKTVLLFTSDNGPADRATREGIASAGPFRGHKHTNYEGGIRVPSIIAWPNHLAPAQSDYVSGLVDYFPTVMDMLGIDPSRMVGDRPMDGFSLYPVLKGESKGERPGYLTAGYMRLVQDDNGIAIIQNRYKLLRPRHNIEFELYDLENDPAETRNLAATMPDKVREMSASLDAWMASAMNSLKGGDYRY
jgi:arylsulfatase A-like enzyme